MPFLDKYLWAHVTFELALNFVIDVIDVSFQSNLSSEIKTTCFTNMIPYFSWILLTCAFKVTFSENALLHFPHWNEVFFPILGGHVVCW